MLNVRYGFFLQSLDLNPDGYALRKKVESNPDLLRMQIHITVTTPTGIAVIRKLQYSYIINYIIAIINLDLSKIDKKDKFKLNRNRFV